MEQFKRCSNCKHWKSIKEYWKRYSNSRKANIISLKFQARCITCTKAIRSTKSYKVYIRAYQKTPKRIQYERKFRKAYHQRPSQHYKVLARNSVHNARVNKKLPDPKTLSCIKCGVPAAHYHHHRGYSKKNRLNVVPICVTCHTHITR